MKKAELIRALQEVHRAFNDLLARIPAERMNEPGALDSWSIKDVIAHLAWHEREMVGMLQAHALVGSELWNLPLDQRNQAI